MTPQEKADLPWIIGIAALVGVATLMVWWLT
jgi:hypothetical protein